MKFELNKLKNAPQNLKDQSAQLLFGEQALDNRKDVEIVHPMEAGVVQDWVAMKQLWEYAFYDRLALQKGSFGDESILLTEAPMNPKRNRERMAEIMFEDFGFGRVHVAVQAVLTLYARGMQTGVVLDVGDGVAHVVPVYEGSILDHQVRRLDIAGRDVTHRLAELVSRRGFPLSMTSSNLECAREVKENACFVSVNPSIDRKLALETTALNKTIKLHDGRTLTTNTERFEAPEILFSPHLIGKESPGISRLLFDAIQAAPIDIRVDLYKHIVLSGGTTMFPGLPTRIERDLEAFHASRPGSIDSGKQSARVKVKIEDPPERRHIVFLGAAVLADLMKDNDAFWVQRAEWQEQGPAVLRR